MDDHLKLYFTNEEASDEAVLAVMPSAIRKKVLRHLFGHAIKECFLFAGTPRRFRDAVMAETRVELFLPQVDILSEGDTVNEIYLIVQGSVEARPAPNRLAGLGGGGRSYAGSSSPPSTSSLATSTSSADSLDIGQRQLRPPHPEGRGPVRRAGLLRGGGAGRGRDVARRLPRDGDPARRARLDAPGFPGGRARPPGQPPVARGGAGRGRVPQPGQGRRRGSSAPRPRRSEGAAAGSTAGRSSRAGRWTGPPTPPW